MLAAYDDGRGVLWWACLSVCLSAIISSELHIRSSPNFLCLLPTAMAQSCSDGIVMRYMFLVLWMTSYLHITPAEAGTWLSDPGGIQGLVDLVGWLHAEMIYSPIDPGTKWAWRELTLFVRWTPLTTTPCCQPRVCVFVFVCQTWDVQKTAERSIWDVDLGGSNELCIRWGLRSILGASWCVAPFCQNSFYHLLSVVQK